ncbi:MAG: alpha/beta hydrolase [Vulcanimicrobiaceae bacterium]
MLDPQARALLDFLASLERPPIWEVPIAVAREASTAMNVRFAGAPQSVADVRELCIAGPAGPIPARAYIPASDAPHAVLAYFHGGGFTIGSLEGYDATLRALANASGVTIVSVDYRLAPEHPFPAGLEDCYAATVWIAQNAASLGADAARLAVGGDSAGGNLATVVALLALERNGPDIAFQLLIYPTTDGDTTRESYAKYGEGHLLTTELCKWFSKQYVPPDRASDVLHRPLHAPSLARLPPAHVLVAECDPLYDEALAYARALRSSGVPTTFAEYPGMIHGFFNYSGMLDASRQAVSDAGAILRAALTPASKHE